MRYRKNKNVLKVRNANRDDTGIYTCKGINGFGSSEARIEVIIVGESFKVQILSGHVALLSVLIVNVGAQSLSNLGKCSESN